MSFSTDSQIEAAHYGANTSQAAVTVWAIARGSPQYVAEESPKAQRSPFLVDS